MSKEIENCSLNNTPFEHQHTKKEKEKKKKWKRKIKKKKKSAGGTPGTEDEYPTNSEEWTGKTAAGTESMCDLHREDAPRSSSSRPWTSLLSMLAQS
jgi:hypothetical protein